MLNNLYNQY